MTTTKIDYESIFKMFCEKEGYRENMMQPFKQNGNYYATDEVSLIWMPIGGEMELNEQVKPDVKNAIPVDFHEPIAIDVAKFKQAIVEHTPLVDEFIDKEHKCTNCDGFGTKKCDLGHEHDCENCNRKGVIEGKNPSGNKIPDENTVFHFMGSALTFIQLMRLIKASEMLGVEKIYKITGNVKQPFCFKVGNTHILVMVCYISDPLELVELPFNF